MIEIFAELIWAARINLYFALIALPLGFVLALGLALALAARSGLRYYGAAAYVYFFRGSPLFIQLYFFYFFLRAMGVHRVRVGESPAFDFVLDALFLAPFVLLLNTAAYTAVILANALKAVPRGDLEAAEAFGFDPLQKFWRITWPSMLRIAWPAYTNEAVFLFLGTTAVYASLPLTRRPDSADYRDIFRVAADVEKLTFNPFAAYLPAMAVFVCLTLMIFFVFGMVNQYLNRHLGEQGQVPRLKFRPNFIR